MEQICADLEAEHAALDAVVADLTEQQWNAATPAEAWDVKDTIVHLVQADIAARIAVTDPERFVELKQGLLESGFEGTFGSKEGKSGKDILAWWRDERRQMVEAFRSRGPKERIPWFGPDMSTLSFATARLMETWSHGRDVADTVGAPWEPTGRLRHVAHIGVTTRGWSYVNRGMEPPEGPVRVELLSPSGEVWSWGPEDAADRLTGSAEEFCLVVTQRRRPEETALVADGPLAQEWLGLAQAFAGPATFAPSDRVGSLG
ncbi:MAG: TIGR03084 family metal-binding protein [Acidimicrobiales bacterium]